MLRSGAKVASDILGGEEVGEALKKRGKEGLGQLLQDSSEVVMKGKGFGKKPIKVIKGLRVLHNDVFTKYGAAHRRKKRAGLKK